MNTLDSFRRLAVFIGGVDFLKEVFETIGE